MRIITAIFTAVLSTVIISGVVSLQASAAQNPFQEACKGLTQDQKEESAACSESGSKNPISGGTDSILYKITLLVSAVAGAIAVIIIIIAGISMITSSGDSQKLGNARNTIIYAVVGLIVIILAQALITFIITNFT